MSRAFHILSVLALVALAACSAGEEIVITWPAGQSSDVESDWVLLLEREHELSALAHASGSGPLHLELGASETAELYALAYDEGLAKVDLVPGALEIVTDPAVRSRRLPVPDDVYRATISSERRAQPWSAAELSPRGATLRIRDDRPSQCASFVAADQIGLDTPSPYVWFIAALDGGAQLVGGSDWDRLVVDGDLGVWNGPAVSATFRREDGMLLLASREGAWLGRWEASSWVTSATIADAFPEDPAAVRTDAAGKVFALSYEGRLSLLRDGAWTLVYDYSPLEGTNAGGLTSTPDGRVLAVYGASRHLIEVLPDGTVVDHDLQAIGSAGITAVTWLSDLGVVFGTANGELYAWDGGGEVRLLADLAAAPRVLLPFRGSVFIGGDQALVAEYRMDEGLCPPASVLSGNIRAASIDGDRIHVAHIAANVPTVTSLRFVEPNGS